MQYSARDQDWPGGDIVTHFRFCTTMQLRTPLEVLKRHNDTYWDRSAPPPVFITEPWQGIWVPCTRLSGLFENGATMASEIGQIPISGGDFLRFLLIIREALEGLGCDKRDAVLSAAKSESWAPIVQKLGGPEMVANRLCSSGVL
ncbi:hypothetical protein [Pseudomonas sp. Ost2]|uniref:hypothetical protein n=1 Tax=Pseudomonas sp. Ost2 TaxID=2678260 RepID=UPI001FD3D895|nr:hypothetical protein [Pseudomonas sp. Ost2]